jgi:hypothetical protein
MAGMGALGLAGEGAANLAAAQQFETKSQQVD